MQEEEDKKITYTNDKMADVFCGHDVSWCWLADVTIFVAIILRIVILSFFSCLKPHAGRWCIIQFIHTYSGDLTEYKEPSSRIFVQN